MSPNGYRWNWLERPTLRFAFGLLTLPLSVLLGAALGIAEHVRDHWRFMR